MFAAAIIVSIHGGYYMAQPCDKIDFALKGKENVMQRYPECESFYSGTNTAQHAAVRAKIASSNVIEVSTAFNVTYGMSGWLAFVIHAVTVELYVSNHQNL
jgi:hypothetical protein